MVDLALNLMWQRALPDVICVIKPSCHTRSQRAISKSFSPDRRGCPATSPSPNSHCPRPHSPTVPSKRNVAVLPSQQQHHRFVGRFCSTVLQSHFCCRPIAIKMKKRMKKPKEKKKNTSTENSRWKSTNSKSGSNEKKIVKRQTWEASLTQFK
jgi:hypothetical protein